MKKIGVMRSGCGVFDGSELHEAVLTLLEIAKSGAQAICMAPNKAQMHVINHLTGEPTEETRNVLEESARIARGDIVDLATVGAGDLDALILPGGFGAAKNLSTFAVAGAQGVVDAEVKRLVEAMHAARKPIGFICIAPAVGAQILGDKGISVTIGNDADTAEAIESCGATHVACGVNEIYKDATQRIISTPAYMLGPTITDVHEGIAKLVHAVVEWTNECD